MTATNMLTPLAMSTIAIKGTLLLLIGWSVTRILRNATASVRHVVWQTVIVGMLLVPVIALVAPISVAVLPGTPERAPTTASSPAQAVPGTAVPGALAALPSRIDAPRSNTPTPASMALVLWAAVAFILLVRVVRSLNAVQRILRGSRAVVAAEWQRALANAACELGVTPLPRLLASDQVEIAFTCSLLSPTIVIPAGAEEWSADRRRAVLLHELAHIRRRDLASHAIANVACAVYWFNPLVWIAARRLRVESEMASDEVVLDAGIRPSAYAEHLLDMVTSFGKRAPHLALAMAEPREFEGRLVAILDRANLRAVGRTERRAMIGAVGVLSLSIGAIAPVSEHAPAPAALPAPLPVVHSPVARRVTPPPARPATGGTQLSEAAALTLRRIGVGAIANPVVAVLHQEARLELTGVQADSLAMLGRSYLQKLTALWRPVLAGDANGSVVQLGRIPERTVDVMREVAPLVRGLLTPAQLARVDAATAGQLDDVALRTLRRSVAVTPSTLIAADGPGARIGGGGTPTALTAQGGRAGR